jgi:hypothetical protein
MCNGGIAFITDNCIYVTQGARHVNEPVKFYVIDDDGVARQRPTFYGKRSEKFVLCSKTMIIQHSAVAGLWARTERTVLAGARTSYRTAGLITRQDGDVSGPEARLLSPSDHICSVT